MKNIENHSHLGKTYVLVLPWNTSMVCLFIRQCGWTLLTRRLPGTCTGTLRRSVCSSFQFWRASTLGTLHSYGRTPSRVLSTPPSYTRSSSPACWGFPFSLIPWGMRFFQCSQSPSFFQRREDASFSPVGGSFWSNSRLRRLIIQGRTFSLFSFDGCLRGVGCFSFWIKVNLVRRSSSLGRLYPPSLIASRNGELECIHGRKDRPSVFRRDDCPTRKVCGVFAPRFTRSWKDLRNLWGWVWMP